MNQLLVFYIGGICPIPNSHSIFSSRRFIVFSIIFISMIHFKLIFIWCELRIKVFFYIWLVYIGNAMFPAPLVEKTILFTE